MRQARNAAKAVYFELDVNRAAISVARDHGLFSDLDRSSFERLLPELATLLAAPDLKTVVDAYMTVDGSGDRGTAIFRTRYPDESIWWVLNVYELRDGLISRCRAFLAPEFEAPDWRAPFHEDGRTERTSPP